MTQHTALRAKTVPKAVRIIHPFIGVRASCGTCTSNSPLTTTRKRMVNPVCARRKDNSARHKFIHIDIVCEHQ
jgi:hypothetical protein